MGDIPVYTIPPYAIRINYTHPQPHRLLITPHPHPNQTISGLA